MGQLVKSVAVCQMIQSIRSFLDAKLDSISPHSLVVFDVDETLITPVDVLLKPAGRSFQGWAKIEPEQLVHYLSIMLANTEYVLVEEIIPRLIQDLFEKGIAAMALTACSTGPIGVISSMEEWRFDQLYSVGIDFSPFFKEEYIFSELVGATSSPPLFKRGILFCGDLQNPQKSAKGELLGIFLDRIDWKPERVIFIDDDRSHLEAVLLEMGQRGIAFQGYHLERPSLQLDEQVAYYQVQTLLDTNKWIKWDVSKMF